MSLAQAGAFVTDSALPYLQLGPAALVHELSTALGPARGRYLAFRW